jgi:hypothetical protein
VELAVHAVGEREAAVEILGAHGIGALGVLEPFIRAADEGGRVFRAEEAAADVLGRAVDGDEAGQLGMDPAALFHHPGS